MIQGPTFNFISSNFITFIEIPENLTYDSNQFPQLFTALCDFNQIENGDLDFNKSILSL